jgi:peptide/nickel transport system substrate-binding protein
MAMMRSLKFLLILCLLLSACHQQNATSANIVFAISQAPLNLDPRYATDAASERVNRLLYQRLVEFDSTSKVVAGIASWQMLSPSQYQFQLAENLPEFHHHKALTAQDVKATYDSLLTLKDSPHNAEFSNIANIKVLDNKRVVFQLKQTDKHFPEKLIIGILPQDLIVKAHDFSRQPVGNGPLKFVSWQSALLLQRVSDGLAFKLIEVKDPTVRVLKLLRGEADLLQGDLPPELVKYLQTKPNVTVNSNIGVNFSYLGLNMQDAKLKDIRVRQAIAYAIDRPAIIDKILISHSRLAGALLPPEHYAGNAHLSAYLYQPALAKKLLLQAGVSLPLKLVYKTSTDAQRVRIATILQAQMALAGIDLEIRSLDWGTFFEDVKQGKFQLYGLTWVGIQTPEIYSKVFGSASFPPNGFNRGRYSDAVLDDLLQQEDWPAVTQRINAQLPYIPLWYEGQFAAYSQHIKNYTPQADGNWDGLATLN